jgi:hypothetical protein
MGEGVVSPELGCEMAEAFIGAKFREMDGIAPEVLEFWQEARDEAMSRGETASAREIEIL